MISPIWPMTNHHSSYIVLVVTGVASKSRFRFLRCSSKAIGLLGKITTYGYCRIRYSGVRGHGIDKSWSGIMVSSFACSPLPFMCSCQLRPESAAADMNCPLPGTLQHGGFGAWCRLIDTDKSDLEADHCGSLLVVWTPKSIHGDQYQNSA